MFNIQNLTNKNICFQNTIIEPYGTISVSSIYDYITLARLTNSGKARYFTTLNKVQKPVTTKEKDVEPSEIVVKPVIQEEKNPEIKDVDFEEPEKTDEVKKQETEKTEESRPEKTIKTYGKKSKKQKEE